MAGGDKKIRVGNPFTRMTGEEPTMFGGRSEELEFFNQALEKALDGGGCEHFLVLGEWGIGKSTLLREYKKICQSRGHFAALVPLEPLQPSTPILEGVSSIVGGIIRDLPYTVDRFKKVVGFFDTIGLNVLGTGVQFSRDTTKKVISPQSLLHDTLARLWEDVESTSNVLVILLDDLDNFMPVPQIVMTLKQTLSMDSMRKSRVLIGIASPTTSWHDLTSTKEHHPLARYFISRVELRALNEKELRETIRKSLEDTGVTFAPEVIARVFQHTEGHPFEMQLLCYHLFKNQLSRKVGVDAWDKAMEATLNDLGLAIFDRWFKQASSEEAKALHILAEADEPLSAKDIHQDAKAAKIPLSPGNVPKYLQRLVEKKLINKSGRGFYTIPDKMFRAYLLNQQT